MRKKNAFTMIETIAGIFIMMIIYSVSFSFVKIQKEMLRSYELKKFTYEIQNILSLSKSICRAEKCYGRIKVSRADNSVTFINMKNNVSYSVKCPADYKIQSNFSYNISRDGIIKGSNTIFIMDDDNKSYEISIKTGVNTITIKGDAK